MLNALLVQVTMLSLISTMLGIVLVIVWRDFGRPVYALSWAAAFGSLALHCVVTVILIQYDVLGRLPWNAISPFQIGNSALLFYGFRQRAGRPGRGRALVAGWLLASLAAAILAYVPPHRDLAALLSKMFSSGLLIGAAAAVAPRGRPASTAEHGARLVLVVGGLCDVALGVLGFLGGASPSIGMLRLYDTVGVFLTPPALTGAGLFIVFLIAADLSARMRRLAGTDALTGLLNRRGINEAIAASAARWARGPRLGAVVAVDLDAFKQLNDRHGHKAGDDMLHAFALLLKGAMRRGELAARLGGEEFAMLLPEVSVADAAARVETIRRDTAMIATADRAVRMTASFGVAALDRADACLQVAFAEALRRADRALMRAKGDGRDKIVLSEDAPIASGDEHPASGNIDPRYAEPSKAAT